MALMHTLFVLIIAAATVKFAIKWSSNILTLNEHTFVTEYADLMMKLTLS